MLHFSRHLSHLLAIALIASFLFVIPTAFIHGASSSKGFVRGATTADLEAAYREAQAGGDKVRILIVPGHEPAYGGAQYSGYYERELVIPLSEKLAAELRTDPNFEVLVSRGPLGWNEDFTRYFDRSMNSIERFVEEHKKAMKKLVRRGKVKENEEQASHNAAPGDVALRLYGITKWANEHDVDLMIHVHLNDSGGRAENEPGPYTGLSVYVPDGQYSNADASREVGEAVFERLSSLSAKSTLPIEDKGVVEDQELIALGAYNTAEVPSILVEYSYLYEPKNTEEAVRGFVYADQAYQTALGVKDAFGVPSGAVRISRALPFTWRSDVAATTTATSTGAGADVYALQVALRELGFYPQSPSTLIDCPVDGVMRECVTRALTAFQTSKGIEATGTLGPSTRLALNALYSATPYAEAPAPSTIAVSGGCTPFGITLSLEATDADTGGAVTRLQRILAKDPSVYPEGKVTGYFGPATDKAVKAFQKENGIAAPGNAGYGLVGPATGSALLSLCAA